MNLNFRQQLILCLFLLVSTLSFSQDGYERKLSISQWITEMKQSKDSVYRLENAIIAYDKEFDDTSRYMVGEWKRVSFEINKPVELEKCSLSLWLFNCKWDHLTLSDSNLAWIAHKYQHIGVGRTRTRICTHIFSGFSHCLLSSSIRRCRYEYIKLLAMRSG